MTEQPSTQHVMTEEPVDVSATDAAEADSLLSGWLGAIEKSSLDRKESFRSQVNGMRDALKLVVQQKFGHNTHVGKIVVSGGGQSYSVFFHYQIPVVSSADRRPKDNAAAKLAGIVKDPGMTKSAPVAPMLAIHMYVAGHATNRSVQLQADFPGLIKYYEKFGYTVDAGTQTDKPFMTASLDAMSISEAAAGQ